jgi:hypothetical protein
MATIDVFKQKPFQMVELSAAVQRAPYLPPTSASWGIFTPKRVRTTSVAIERKGGTLSLIQTSERGAPLGEGSREKRDIRDFRTLRIAKGHDAHATELQNIRAFGSRASCSMVQNEIGDSDERVDRPARSGRTHAREHAPRRGPGRGEGCRRLDAVTTGSASSVSRKTPRSTSTSTTRRRPRARCARSATRSCAR